MEWREAPTGESWALMDDIDIGFTTTRIRVAVVNKNYTGVVRREYLAHVIHTQESMKFTTLEDAKTWAQTTYRLTK